MPRKKILAAMALSICLALVMLQVRWVDAKQLGNRGPKYNFLSPRGTQPTVEVSALAPRLDSIAGKTIYVDQGEADPVIMPALWDRLTATYPEVNWKLIAVSSFGPSSPEQEVLQDADAVIRGVGW